MIFVVPFPELLLHDPVFERMKTDDPKPPGFRQMLERSGHAFLKRLELIIHTDPECLKYFRSRMPPSP